MKKTKTPDKHWNYRVLANQEHKVTTFGIHEVYYEHGKPVSYTEKSISPYGESAKELKKCLKMMRRALKEPVIRCGKGFPKEFKNTKSKK